MSDFLTTLIARHRGLQLKAQLPASERMVRSQGGRSLMQERTEGDLSPKELRSSQTQSGRQPIDKPSKAPPVVDITIGKLEIVQEQPRQSKRQDMVSLDSYLSGKGRN